MRAEFLIDYCQQADWQHPTGHYQSPIDIQTNQTEPGEMLTEPRIEFSAETATFLNNGQNLQLLGSGQLWINQRAFTFVQVHFHADSEHWIDGQKFPLEGHFLFQSSTGQTAVIGVLYQLGKFNTDFEHILTQYQQKTGIDTFSAADLIPENKSYYHYIGSLTTPPLTEGIEWYVMKTVLEIAPEQVQHFIELHGKNCRTCQPLEGRKVWSYQE